MLVLSQLLYTQLMVFGFSHLQQLLLCIAATYSYFDWCCISMGAGSNLYCIGLLYLSMAFSCIPQWFLACNMSEPSMLLYLVLLCLCVHCATQNWLQVPDYKLWEYLTTGLFYISIQYCSLTWWFLACGVPLLGTLLHLVVQFYLTSTFAFLAV